jgi:Holliday junction resolvase-like predicted endonuclease
MPRPEPESAAAVVELKQLAAGVYRRSSYAVAAPAVAAVRRAAREYVDYMRNHEPAGQGREGTLFSAS